MSLHQFFDGRRPATTDTAVRVFPAVARTPRLPEPKWWNNPLGVVPVTMVVSVTLSLLPNLPVLSGLVALAFGFVLAVVEAVGYFAWPESRDKAVIEGAWVAHQSGYRISVHGDDLHWIDQDGMVKTATIVRGRTGWDLVLIDQDVAGSFAF